MAAGPNTPLCTEPYDLFDLPRSKQAAKLAGLTAYFTGRPCKHGHLCERYIDGHCKQCRRQGGADYRARTPEKQAARRIAYRSANREAYLAASRAYDTAHQEQKLERSRRRYQEKKHEILAYFAAYRAANAEKRSAYSKQWRAQNPERAAQTTAEYYAAHKEKRRQQSAEWYAANKERKDAAGKAWIEANRGLRRAQVAARQRRTRQATPVWADLSAVARFYEEAVRLTIETGIPHEVDHIIPITHQLVCGLHVETNLRVVPRSLNRKKHNRFDPDALALAISGSAFTLDSPA